MGNELHISSLIVHGKPAHRAQIAAVMSTLPGLEIHAVSEQGKFIVTLETADEAAILDCIHRINHIDGVLSTVLVYHHNEGLDSLEEEVNYENDSPGVC